MPGVCCWFEMHSHQDNSIMIANSRKSKTCRKAEQAKPKESYSFKQEKITVLRITQISTYFLKVSIILAQNMRRREENMNQY